VGDIKKHKWFSGFDYNALLSKQLRPPYVPASSAVSDKETNWHKDKLSLAPEIKKKDDPFASW
jgi:protein kinase A